MSEASHLLREAMDNEAVWTSIWVTLRWDVQHIHRIYELFSRYSSPCIAPSVPTMLEGGAGPNRFTSTSYRSIDPLHKRRISLEAVERCFYDQAFSERCFEDARLTPLAAAFFHSESLNCIQFLRLCALCSMEAVNDVTHPCGLLRLAGIYRRYDSGLKGHLNKQDVARMCSAIHYCTGTLPAFKQHSSYVYALLLDENGHSDGVAFEAFVRAVHQGLLCGTSTLLRMRVLTNNTVAVITSRYNPPSRPDLLESPVSNRTLSVQQTRYMTQATWAPPATAPVAERRGSAALNIFTEYKRCETPAVSDTCNPNNMKQSVTHSTYSRDFVGKRHALGYSRSIDSKECCRFNERWTYPLIREHMKIFTEPCTLRKANCGELQRRRCAWTKATRKKYPESRGSFINLDIPPLMSHRAKGDLDAAPVQSNVSGPASQHQRQISTPSLCTMLVDVRGPSDRPWENRCYASGRESVVNESCANSCNSKCPDRSSINLPAQQPRNKVIEGENPSKPYPKLCSFHYWTMVHYASILLQSQETKNATVETLRRTAKTLHSSTDEHNSDFLQRHYNIYTALLRTFHESYTSNNDLPEKPLTPAERDQQSMPVLQQATDEKDGQHFCSSFTPNPNCRLGTIVSLVEATAQYISRRICEHHLLHSLRYRAGTYTVLVQYLLPVLWNILLMFPSDGNARVRQNHNVQTVSSNLYAALQQMLTSYMKTSPPAASTLRLQHSDQQDEIILALKRDFCEGYCMSLSATSHFWPVPRHVYHFLNTLNVSIRDIVALLIIAEDLHSHIEM